MEQLAKRNGFLSSCAEREALAIRAPNTQRREGCQRRRINI
jgi:hypothetical protein